MWSFVSADFRLLLPLQIIPFEPKLLTSTTIPSSIFLTSYFLLLLPLLCISIVKLDKKTTLTHTRMESEQKNIENIDRIDK